MITILKIIITFASSAVWELKQKICEKKEKFGWGTAFTRNTFILIC